MADTYLWTTTCRPESRDSLLIIEKVNYLILYIDIIYVLCVLSYMLVVYYGSCKLLFTQCNL